MNPSVLLYCRPGFERECAQELSHFAGAHGIDGYVKSKPDSGWLLFVPYEESAAQRLQEQLQFSAFTFPRQIVHQVTLVEALPTTNRATPLADAATRIAQQAGLRFAEVWLETADTNDAKELSAFCRKFQPHMEKALRAQNLLSDKNPHRLHIFFLDSASAYVGVTETENSSAWPMGIPRLKAIHGAPSRSAQKLAEALGVFLTADERADRLHEGITGVDLGAAPGGWTWVLVRHGLQVTAVDNGKLAPALMETGQVEHLRVDGFSWRPRRPVHWLVCDMVEKPAKVAALMAAWLADGHCSEIIFNLKLPMKKRYEEVELCQSLIAERLESARIPFSLALRQLYHDREEVTGHLRRSTPPSRRKPT